jgi:hypothetical protein
MLVMVIETFKDNDVLATYRRSASVSATKAAAVPQRLTSRHRRIAPNFHGCFQRMAGDEVRLLQEMGLEVARLRRDP